MTKEDAQKQLKAFFTHYPMLTFTIKEYENDEWIAQCNEVDGIITGGKGFDQAYMEDLMQDAILTAAGIPYEYSDNMLKRVWSPDLIQSTTESQTKEESVVSVRNYQSIYKIDHFNVGNVQFS